MSRFNRIQKWRLSNSSMYPLVAAQVQQIRNFWDRIALKYILNPLNSAETKEIIDYRLRQAGYKKNAPLFNEEALGLIFQT